MVTFSRAAAGRRYRGSKFAVGVPRLFGHASASHTLAVNASTYAELSIAFARIEELEEVLKDGGLALEPIPLALAAPREPRRGSIR